MNSLVLANYPAGISPILEASPDASLAGLIERSCRNFATNTALVQGDARLTYAELGELSRNFATWLRSDLGLAPGARVALMMPNILAFPIAIAGVLRAGCVLVNVNPMYTARELKHQLEDSGACVMVVAAPFVETVKAVLTENNLQQVVVAPMSGRPDIATETLFQEANNGMLDFAEVLACQSEWLPPILSRSDTALLQYTGGTTGPSKGAQLTHGNLLSNISQFGGWIDVVVEPRREVIVTALPLYHIFALMVNFLSFLRIGAKNVLITDPRDLASMAATMGREGCTALTGVNTLFNGLLNTPSFAEQDFEQLRLVMAGGAAIQPAIARRWQEVTGKALVEGYGLSETSPILTVNRIDTGSFRPGIGLPLPSTDISIRDEAGAEVATGEAGELCARGPQVMKGYWKQPEANARAFTEDGYFRTGDMARQDEEGYFHIVDRKKDMVLVSGFNVYPNEVEAVCVEHPGVLECACIGVPDSQTGEAVKVFAVRRDITLTEQQLTDFCRANLAAYKVPKQVAFITELPKSPVGKILRRKLRVPQ